MKLAVFFIFILLNVSHANLFSGKRFSYDSALKRENTFIFWVNGDSDRFRPSEGIGSKNIRIDTLDLQRIKELSKTCDCNVLIFHDQRLSDKWYTRARHYAAFVYAYASGKAVEFIKEVKRRDHKKREWIKREIKRNYIEFNEVNQNTEFIASLFNFTKRLFPETNYHLVYRGHSFAESIRKKRIPFDRSHPETNFHKEELEQAILKTDILFETVTFAACSMANISFAKMLSNHSQWMIGSQVTINETGLTGFNYEFLNSVRNGMDIKTFAEEVAKGLLKNFDTVKDINLAIRETPASLIDLRAIRSIKEDITAAEEQVRSSIKNESIAFNKAKIEINVSNRYLSYRKANGASQSEIETAAKYIKVPSSGHDYDLGEALKIDGFTNIAQDLKKAVKVFGGSGVSRKTGLSFDLSYR